VWSLKLKGVDHFNCYRAPLVRILGIRESSEMVEVWARFDAETNALDSLEKALYFLGKVKETEE